MNTKFLKAFEWVAASLSIAATTLLAVQGHLERIRFVSFALYLVANLLFVSVFFNRKMYGPAIMNMVFIGTSIVGLIKNW